MKYKTIRVEQKHIDRGTPQSACECMVALALRDAGFKYPAVCLAWLLLNNGVTCDVPLRVKRAIRRFDKGKPVKPFAFKIPAEAFANAQAF